MRAPSTSPPKVAPITNPRGKAFFWELADLGENCGGGVAETVDSCMNKYNDRYSSKTHEDRCLWWSQPTGKIKLRKLGQE
jgi:hypothetical protein